MRRPEKGEPEKGSKNRCSGSQGASLIRHVSIHRVYKYHRRLLI